MKNFRNLLIFIRLLIDDIILLREVGIKSEGNKNLIRVI